MKILGVSVGSVDNLTTESILKCYLIANTSMECFKWEGIDNTLEVMEMRLDKRFGK